MSKTAGGDVFILRVENECTVSALYSCDPPVPSVQISGLPIIKQMTDKGDGTYTADYTVSSSGTVTVSAELLKAGGAHEYYFGNQNWAGTPSYSTVSEINYDWGGSSNAGI